jgi:hypothetical protein
MAASTHYRLWPKGGRVRTRLLIVEIAPTVQGLAAQTAPILIDITSPIKLCKYPTIVVRTPYGVQREGSGIHDRLIAVARSGYAVVNTDMPTLG